MPGPNTDPTYQTKGQLVLSLVCNMNVSSQASQNPVLGLSSQFNQLIYSPPAQPPPAWTAGQQYVISNGTVYGFGAMVAPQNASYSIQAGAFVPLTINDMSSNSVVTEKGYQFTIDIGDNQWGKSIQLFALISGVAGGSVVTPGFGLFNLGKRPLAWTYVTPKQFTGDWQIGLLTPHSQTPMWLSVDYAPPKNYGQGLQARLNFAIAGAIVYYSLPQRVSEIQEVALDLHPRSDPHLLRTAS
jgi:hypothetical protein